MKVIQFDPKGGKLLASIKFTGLIAAAYGLKLAEANSNQKVFYEEGDNQNTEDDKYYLPVPVEDNNGRVLRLTTDFYGLDPKNYPDYKIELEIYQGNKLLGSESDTDKVTGKTQSSLIFLKLSI